MNEELVNILASVVANATPLVIASIGETINERAGITNLSLDGTLQLSAMVAFAAALVSGNIVVGLLAAMVVSGLIALLIAFADIRLRQDQIAVGFVLTLLAADVAQFLGQEYTREPGPRLLAAPIPVLSDLPVVGQILFNQNLLVYFSFLLIFATWWFLFHTRLGLAARAAGERPEAAYARGTRVNRTRYLYTVVGGVLVGIAGASYSLAIKPGWATPPVMRGDGWIALAIVIFGGWHPFRAAFGAYLFAGLRALASAMQRSDVGIPLVLLNALPWLLMIGTLLVVSSGAVERLLRLLPLGVQRWTRNVLRSDPPQALGVRFERE